MQWQVTILLYSSVARLANLNLRVCIELADVVCRPLFISKVHVNNISPAGQSGFNQSIIVKTVTNSIGFLAQRNLIS